MLGLEEEDVDGHGSALRSRFERLRAVVQAWVFAHRPVFSTSEWRRLIHSVDERIGRYTEADCTWWREDDPVLHTPAAATRQAAELPVRTPDPWATRPSTNPEQHAKGGDAR
jgi:hypothetical protein